MSLFPLVYHCKAFYIAETDDTTQLIEEHIVLLDSNQQDMYCDQCVRIARHRKVNQPSDSL